MHVSIFKMRHFLGLCALVFALILSACHKAPPEINPAKYAAATQANQWKPDKDRTDILLEEEKIAAADSLTDQSTQDLKLLQLIDIALKNNPSTRIAWAQAKAAAASWGMS
ncbi:MAG: hypothetical protein ABIE74_10255, partial [Pseudomonadota bacterium]